MNKIDVLTAATLAVLAAAVSMPVFAQQAVGAVPNLPGQIGWEYDPLFYDVMVYVFGTMIFAVFLLSVIAYWIRRKGVGTSNEKWVLELQKHYEREGMGLLPEESRK
jgi:hypothetical protein